DRLADRIAIVEVAGRILLFEDRVVLRRRHEADELARQTDVRDVVRCAEVHVDLRVLVHDDNFEVTDGAIGVRDARAARRGALSLATLSRSEAEILSLREIQSEPGR